MVPPSQMKLPSNKLEKAEAMGKRRGKVHDLHWKPMAPPHWLGWVAKMLGFAQLHTLPFLQAGSKTSPVRGWNPVTDVKDLGRCSGNPLDFSKWPELTMDSYSSGGIGSSSSINSPCGVCPPFHSMCGPGGCLAHGDRKDDEDREHFLAFPPSAMWVWNIFVSSQLIA